ncbi:MAG: CoA transferase, partial [Betaproteobacteria bacterium]|nr:CoA transferase [Betaproteobacteria bacterium]
KWVCLSASTQPMTERVFRAIGRPDLIDNPRYRTNAERVKNAAELDAVIGAFVAQKTLAENLEFFDRTEVTVGPVYDISQIIEDPYVKAREVVVELPDDEMGTVPMHCVVPRLSATPGAIRLPAPRLGEHNDEVLGALGLPAAEIARLKTAGVISTGRKTKGVAAQ